MPAAREHEQAWKSASPLAIVLSVVLAGAGFQKEMPELFGVSLGVLEGYILGRYLDPDMDLIGMTGAKGRALRELSLLGLVWSMFWMPYAWVMQAVGGHRSILTHAPVLSTIVRLMYLYGIMYIICISFKIYLPAWVYPNLLGIAIGLALSDLVHIFLDFK